MFKLRIRRLCLFFLAALFLFTAAHPVFAQAAPINPAMNTEYQNPPCPLSSNYGVSWDSSMSVTCLRSIVIFVHGVNSSSNVYSQWIDGLFKSGNYPELSNTFYVWFDWRGDALTQASDQVGGRANSVTGMSDRAFYAVWKLGQTVARIKRLFPELPITIVSHSQGSLVTLAALQEGMTLDNWILMGSPLDKEIVAGCEAGENVDLVFAARQVRGWVWNFSSDEDFWAGIEGGIGTYGLQGRCDGQSYGSNVYNMAIPNIDHFGGTSWWDFDHIRSSMTSEQFNWLLLTLTANNGNLIGYLKGDIDWFNSSVFPFAADIPMMCVGQEFCVEYRFQDSDYDSFYYDFLLPQGLLTGWYMDDKDRGRYTLTCWIGGASVRMLGAQWSTFDEGQDWMYVAQGNDYDSSYTVDSWVNDATLWVQIYNADPGISQCTLWFEAWDD